MKQLKFYIDNIDSNLLNSISGRPGQLIQLILSGHYLNEEALEAHLFEGKWDHQNYLNVKSRAKRVLSAYFLISPPKKNNEIIKKLRHCRKLCLLGMGFIESGHREEAKKMMQDVFKIAEEYGFTRLAYDSAMELRIDASTNKKHSKFSYYNDRIHTLQIATQAEQIAEEYYYKWAMHLNTKRNLSHKTISNLIKNLSKFSCLSVKYTGYYYTLCITRDLVAFDYHTLKQSAGTALKILQNKKGVYRSVLQNFSRNKAIAHIALGEYGEAKSILIDAEQYAPPRSYNRNILYYYQALNALHSGDYDDAHQLYRQHRKTTHPSLSEQWAIMGAYLYFLKWTGRLQTNSERFSVGKYLNETVPSSHDKAGSNVCILIGEMLVYLVKNRERFIDRVDSARSYTYLYLKGKATRRARWLIHLLCHLPRANFNNIALARVAQKQIVALEQNPVYEGCDLSLEIIPYGTLLPLIEEVLEKKIA